MRTAGVKLGALLLSCAAPLAAQQPKAAQSTPVEIVVQGARSAPPGSTTLSADSARSTPGTQGDAVKGLQGLPGLGRGGPGGGDLTCWGSTPGESSVLLDGVEIPLLYHGSGVRSVVPAGLVEALSAVPGGFGAEHGRAVGGLVLLKTRPADTSHTHLGASVDLLDASVLGSTPLASGKAALRASLRGSYVDRWLPRLIDPRLRGLYRVPRYVDAEAEAHLQLSASESARLVFLASHDSSSAAILGDDPAAVTRDYAAQGFGRLYLLYRSLGESGQETSVTPFVGWDSAETKLNVGSERADLSHQALRYGLRAQHHAPLARGVSLAFGVDAAGSLARVERTGSLSVPRREGDPYPFGTAPGAALAHDDFRAHRLGLGTFAQTELQLATLRITTALRFEPTLLEVSRSRPPLGRLPDVGTSHVEALFEPRLMLEQRLSSRVRLVAAAGRYHQLPDATDLSARFGNPSLSAASASHLSLGEVTSLTAKTRLEVTVFAKWLSDLAVRSADPEPRLGQTLTGTGHGRAFGTQLFLRQGELGGFTGWLSATLSRSERSDAEGKLRLSDLDAPLLVAAVLQKKLGSWRVGSRARFASGLPRTPVLGSYYDLTSQRYQPLLGATNTVRLADFFQLDLRVDRSFAIGRSGRLELYLDALNVTLQKNQEEWAYSSDFRSVVSVRGLPPLLLVGVTVLQ